MGSLSSRLDRLSRQYGADARWQQRIAAKPPFDYAGFAAVWDAFMAERERAMGAEAFEAWTQETLRLYATTTPSPGRCGDAATRTERRDCELA